MRDLEGRPVRSRVLSLGGTLIVSVLFVGALTAVRVGPLQVLAAAPPDQQLETAATKVEAALRDRGFSFTVVSRSTLVARPGGPKIEVPDPANRFRTLGLADQYYVGGSIAEGFVTPDGYFLQMRRGPATADAAPDFGKAEATLAALVRDGRTFRDDGRGWYGTDNPPGIGLDPRTIALLPTLLREATKPVDGDPRLKDGQLLTTVRAEGKVADAPGLMAIDAEAFTILGQPLEFAIDGEGRLVELHAVMRNARQDTYDLVVDTVISISYAAPPPLPDAQPVWVPAGVDQ